MAALARHDPGEPVPLAAAQPPRRVRRREVPPAAGQDREEPRTDPAPWSGPTLLSQRLPPPVLLPPCRALVPAVEHEGWADPEVLRRRAGGVALLLLAVAVVVLVALVLTRPPV